MKCVDKQSAAVRKSAYNSTYDLTSGGRIFDPRSDQIPFVEIWS